MNSVSESLAAGVPIVAFPFFGDQPHNARRVEDFSVGVNLDAYDRTAPGALKESRVPKFDRVSAARLRGAADRLCEGAKETNAVTVALVRAQDAFVRGDVATTSSSDGYASTEDNAADLLRWVGVHRSA